MPILRVLIYCAFKNNHAWAQNNKDLCDQSMLCNYNVLYYNLRPSTHTSMTLWWDDSLTSSTSTSCLSSTWMDIISAGRRYCLSACTISYCRWLSFSNSMSQKFWLFSLREGRFYRRIQGPIEKPLYFIPEQILFRIKTGDTSLLPRNMFEAIYWIFCERIRSI